MPHRYREIAFTDAVRIVQDELGSAGMNAEAMEQSAPNDRLTETEALFLARCESFYLASVSSTGWPYVQHRGGPAGFIRVLGPERIGWAEFAGNRHYITTGNLRGDDRVSLFCMDYANRRRLKIFGHAQIIGPDAPEMSGLAVPGYRARVDRGLVVTLEGFDWNCAQHIPQRFSLAEVEAASAVMLRRIEELEAALAERGG
ncbi:MAG: pyridoxamine 5'-phosphate oxidase family protein [Rhodobacteraceae bacterium]|nr:pyridoxamine 5'-phosphate oxidase family protein [Paracoccaceae bacterium]